MFHVILILEGLHETDQHEGDENTNGDPHIYITVATLALRACVDGATHSDTQQKHAFLTAIE